MIRFDALAQLTSHIGRFEQLLGCADLTRNVPTCPGWDLASLGNHVGGVYRFAATAVNEKKESDTPTGPADHAATARWFTESAHALLDAFARHDSQEWCWTMAPPETVGFWIRRMAHETAMHLWDAESSQGVTTHIDPSVAADAIDEVVTMFFPRQVRLSRIRPLDAAVRLAIDDVETADLVLAGDGMRPHRGTIDATVRGRAEDLLLALWKRKPLAEAGLRISGDSMAAERVLAAALTP
jgi:uncharacterized protein (TIGR03083 family)